MSPACLVWLLAAISAAVADGNVGCQFSRAVCQDGLEVCYDDYAFGQCISKYDDTEGYHFDLGREELRTLEREMERLFVLGYRWTHRYTQCVIQIILLSIRKESDYDAEECSPLADQDLNAALKALEGDEVQKIDPARVAQVKFTPSIQDPRSDYADEVYIPVRDREEEERIEGFPELVIKATDPELYGTDDRTSQSRLRQLLLEKPKRSRERNQLQSHHHQQHAERIDIKEPGVFPMAEYLAAPSLHFTEKYNTPDNFRMGFESKDGNFNEAQLAEMVKEEQKSFNRAYNTPDSFRRGFEIKDLKDADSFAQELPSNEYVPKNGFYFGRQNVVSSPEEREFLLDTFRDAPEDRLSHDLEKLADEDDEDDTTVKQPVSVYAEGGMENLQDDDDQEDATVAGIENLFKDYAALGFKRPERLDVKKPGPNFDTNNFSFKDSKNDKKGEATPHSEEKTPTAEHVDPPPLPVASKPPIVLPPTILKPPMEKKKNPREGPNSRKPTNNSEDNNVVITFNNDMSNWTVAVMKLRSLANLLHIDPNAFSHTQTQGNEVSFRVDIIRSKLSASEIAKKIEDMKDLLNDNALGVASARARGSSGYLPLVEFLESDEQQLYLVSFLLCGVSAAAAIAGITLFIVRRHSRTKDKLSGLTQPDSEASKDYQELCRARMAGKTAGEKPESVIGRISKENESNQAPSSRSSTSSWSEEPALTNMDISTGHMVLSYMEDHLNNKDRLEQEWVALCAYEAEPCSTEVAVIAENAKKNRYPSIVPYDHARVVLNELLNVSGSDYINASTITDHDPRNPAYIATQGPLQNTAPDLWQMVWEQGSVVMVMLTRLTENGTSMCHRYWPEEGSEIYHIYEVHLVSEHIWCDDYLVRSFYLKNLKTAETRTVTQFHFLSWPETGVPLSTKALLEFRRKVNKSYRGRSCPIVVHCSDGIGRTGTYCLIDMVLNRMAKGAKEIDIAATLEHIRDQRPLMVKTKQQFEFVLMAVAEEVHAILKAIPATHSPPPVTKEKE